MEVVVEQMKLKMMIIQESQYIFTIDICMKLNDVKGFYGLSSIVTEISYIESLWFLSRNLVGSDGTVHQQSSGRYMIFMLRVEVHFFCILRCTNLNTLQTVILVNISSHQAKSNGFDIQPHYNDSSYFRSFDLNWLSIIYDFVPSQAKLIECFHSNLVFQDKQAPSTWQIGANNLYTLSDLDLW